MKISNIEASIIGTEIVIVLYLLFSAYQAYALTVTATVKENPCNKCISICKDQTSVK